jgi:hypothetical protein
MNALLMAAFVDELEKDAAVPGLLQKLWSSGAGRTLAGGAIGAGAGALSNPEDRMGGALRGGLIGGAAGYASPLLTRTGRQKAWEGTKYLGAKTKHELTGMGHAPIKPGMKAKDVRDLRKVERLGLTSVPGVVKGMITQPLQTMKGAWQHAGGLGKAMALADVAMGVPHVLDPNTQAGTGEKVLGTLGRSSGYLLGGRMGILGSSVLGGGLGYMGSRAGRLFGGGKPAAEAPSTLGTLSPRAEMLSEHTGRLLGPGQE